MTDLDYIPQSRLFPLAAKAKAEISAWRIANMQNQVALMLAHDPKSYGFIIDLVADTSIDELQDEKLERVIRHATAENLRNLGYEGANSPKGESITPFHTALLHKVKREFGDDAVRLNCKSGGFRGFRNTTEIRKFYADEVQRLIRRLLLVSTEI